MRIVLRFGVANLVFFLCVVVASVLPGFWTGASGRDFLPQAFNASLLIFAASIFIRYKFRWSISHMILSIIPTQIIILLCTSYFSGYTGLRIFNLFNLEWLMFVDLFVCIPWIAGIFVGGFFKNRKKEKTI